MSATVTPKKLAELLTRAAEAMPGAFVDITMHTAVDANTSARANVNAQEGPRAPIGGALSVQPGTLENNIKIEGPVVGAGEVLASVNTDLVYSKMQEYGGVITANGNCGGDGKWLRFRSYRTGEWVTVNSVTIPAKHYMKAGMDHARDALPVISHEVLKGVFA